MSLFFKMVSLQLMLFVLIIVGALIRRIGLLTESGTKTLSTLLLNVILPCNIVHAYMSKVEVGTDFARNSILMIVLSALILVVIAYVNRFLFARFPREQKNVMSYGLICSNSTFIGIPMSEILFGDVAVMYTSMFQIPFRFMMWTAGLSLFTNISRKDAFKKLIRHPCIIAVFVGLLLMLTQISLPGFIDSSITALSSCTTPISMMVIGSSLAYAPVRGLFSPAVLYFTALRLVIVPLAIYAVLLPFGLDQLIVNICVLMSAMPAGSTTTILANQYGCDGVFASEVTFTSTLLSIVTIPLLSLLL
jgi:malate permease and related proteins